MDGLSAPPVTMPDGKRYYLLPVHSSFIEALRLTPRDRWRMEHRAARMRAKGYPRMPEARVAVGQWSGVRWQA